jgi:hypothetical protein
MLGSLEVKKSKTKIGSRKQLAVKKNNIKLVVEVGLCALCGLKTVQKIKKGGRIFRPFYYLRDIIP